MPSDKPKVFISYSARGRADDPSGVEATQSLRRALQTSLEQAGIEVFVDRRIDAGAPWRAVLERWLWRCDAAIILLSSDALESDWVRAEATFLYFRKQAQKDFKLLPVRFPDVTRDDLASAFSPIRISEIQEVDFSHRAPTALVDQITSHLSPLKETFLHPIEEELFSILKRPLKDRDDLAALGELLQIQLDGFPEKQAARRIVRGLIEMPKEIGEGRLAMFENIARKLRALGLQDDFLKVIDNVTPFCWIAPENAIKALGIFLQSSSRAVVWIRGWEESERMLMLRGLCHRRRRLIYADDPSGDADAFRDHVRSCLAKKFYGRSSVSVEQIRRSIRRHILRAEPVYLIASVDTVAPATVRELIAEWPDLSFFFFLTADEEDHDAGQSCSASHLSQLLQATDLDHIPLDLLAEEIANEYYFRYLDFH